MKTNNIRRAAILAALGAIMLLAIVLLVLSYADVGIASEFGDVALPSYDFSTIPQSVVDDANRMAAELFGKGQQYREFANQLLVAYMEARDKDVVIVFNPGGWGWANIDEIVGWRSILSGIKSELDNWGYKSLVLNYRRTSETRLASLKELLELMNRYPSKAKDLADRVEFLTNNIPDIRVVVTGESNGTVIADYTMKILKDNQQVFSIQTGSPFWHKPLKGDKTLLLNSNGVRPDTFSRGDVMKILWTSLKAGLGLSRQEEDGGRVAYVLRAPGHDYSWGYPEVYSQITTFLKEKVLLKER